MSKIAELRQLTDDELLAKTESLNKELFDARFKKATHQLEDTAIFRRLKMQLAQIETILREREIKAAQGDKVHA